MALYMQVSNQSAARLGNNYLKINKAKAQYTSQRTQRQMHIKRLEGKTANDCSLLESMHHEAPSQIMSPPAGFLLPDVLYSELSSNQKVKDLL